jgi:hypothetical protein
MKGRRGRLAGPGGMPTRRMAAFPVDTTAATGYPALSSRSTNSSSS